MILTNAVGIGIAIPIVIALRNVAAGRFTSVMVIGWPVPWDRIPEMHGRFLEYASEYVDGTVNHRIAARELDLSPLEAEIILQALEPVVSEHFEFSG